jgi:hypothetical protein
LCACEMLLPNCGPLPQSSHTCAITHSSSNESCAAELTDSGTQGVSLRSISISGQLRGSWPSRGLSQASIADTAPAATRIPSNAPESPPIHPRLFSLLAPRSPIRPVQPSAVGTQPVFRSSHPRPILIPLSPRAQAVQPGHFP